jgi:uncharacterized protein YkwD
MLRDRKTTVRRTFAVAVLALAVSLTGCLNAQQKSVLEELNADRRANRRTVLAANVEAAQTKAQAWADQLARQGSLSHSNLSSGMSGVRWCGLAENVGYGSSIAAVEDQFMASAGHRANLLGTSWDAVAVGYARSGSRHYVVQFFVNLC